MLRVNVVLSYGSEIWGSKNAVFYSKVVLIMKEAVSWQFFFFEDSKVWTTFVVIPLFTLIKT